MTWPQYLRRTCYVDGLARRLTGRETEVLSVLLMNYPRPLKPGEIVERVWPDPESEGDWAESNVHQIIGCLRGKLGADAIVRRSTLGFVVNQGRGEPPTSKREERQALALDRQRVRALRLAAQMRAMAEELETLVELGGPEIMRPKAALTSKRPGQ